MGASWKTDANQLKKLDPHSAALPVRKANIEQLEEALARAMHAPAWLSIADAHERLSIPASTIRYYCKHNAAEIGAEKHSGMWRIDARSLEAFLAQPHVRATAKAA